MDYSDSLNLASSLPASSGPLVVDIDGTLTNDDRVLEPLVLPVLHAWPAPVVIATGKAMPYPVALCEFLGIEPFVIAENGGVVLVGRSGTLEFTGDREGAAAVVAEFQEQGYDTGWGEADLVNRWRETELAVSRDAPLAPLEAIADQHGLVVIDTGYAYHVKSPEPNKGRALNVITTELGVEPAECVAVGDSINDVPAFELVGHSVSVANGDEQARDAADYVTDAQFGDGFLEAVAWLSETI